MTTDLLAGNVLAVQQECLSPCSNSILRGIIGEALNHENVEEIYGSIDGLNGIVNRNFVDLASQSQQTIRDLGVTPGAILGTSSESKISPEKEDALFSALEAYNIRFLLLTGGLGAQFTALELSRCAQQRNYVVHIITVPDTIYNNLPITDHCLGYGSAAKFIASALREISYHSAAIARHDFINIVEVAGENPDWLIASTLLDKTTPNIPLFPGESFSEEKFLETVQNALKANSHCNVITANRLIDGEGNYITSQNTDAATKLKNTLEEFLEIRVTTVKWDGLQHAAAHFLSKTDLDEAHTCGGKAMHFALTGLTGKMVTLLRSESNRYGVEYGVADLANICGHEKSLPDHWFNGDGKLNNNFLKYASPLIQGNVLLGEDDGLPKFAVLRK
ncbi:MAG: diphosphate--fructose-6-phosphate 1-phosphotransferase [Puniceicoccales bacterium]|jgi:6-phosphofructokinase 1|nr:diphosphate--fructose-6-phosphate 1-phosphotransferase [Puniceicoccales bacterium]